VPVSLWQNLQWQANVALGSVSNSERIFPQRQPPLIVDM